MKHLLNKKVNKINEDVKGECICGGQCGWTCHESCYGGCKRVCASTCDISCSICSRMIF